MEEASQRNWELLSEFTIGKDWSSEDRHEISHEYHWLVNHGQLDQAIEYGEQLGIFDTRPIGYRLPMDYCGDTIIESITAPLPDRTEGNVKEVFVSTMQSLENIQEKGFR